MVWQRDVDLVVPLWQGGGHIGVAAGAAALARMVAPSGGRLHISVADGTPTAHDGVQALDTVADTLQRLHDRLARRDPARVLTLGGDCASDLAAMRHLAARHPGLTVYWVDAHADLNTPATSPSGRAHGMGLRTLLGDGHPRLVGTPAPALHPAQVTLVGTRDLDPAERAYVTAHGIDRVAAGEIAADPRAATARRHAGGPAYIHLDLDVCDPGDLPAVACPTPGGPGTPAVAAALAAIAAHHDLVGAAVCEYTPDTPHDADRVRALLAALGLTG
ncbi:arginase family protein [Nocardiopsis trehalosi]|uniref:arginase family protein n=1 Tax=Nocardiopsis trehalosi TaxID=109329 RepID=UPI0008365BB8|nr:arginase family protein [Nocardiopsis trehalosi]